MNKQKLISKIQKTHDIAEVSGLQEHFLAVEVPGIIGRPGYEYCNQYTNVGYNFDRGTFGRYHKDFLDAILTNYQSEAYCWNLQGDFWLPIFEVWEEDDIIIINLEELEL